MSFDLIQLNTGAGTNVPAQMDLDTGSNPVPRISTEGGLFTLKLDKLAANKPTTTQEVIIIGQYNKGNETQRTFYKGAYSPGSSERPTCSSDNGIAPRGDSTEPQADLCANCPQNKAPKGTRRPCTFHTTLAVVIPGGDQPFQLRVPATSLFGEKKEDEDYFSLNAYKAWFAGRGAQPFHAVTQLQFFRGSQKGYSFVPVRATTPEELALVAEAVGSSTYSLIMRDQALLTAGKAAHTGEEPRDNVSEPAKPAVSAANAEDDLPFEPTNQVEATPAKASRGKSLADALKDLDAAE